ncbi:unnamed protein product, partial [Urochloa humidicola]
PRPTPAAFQSPAASTSSRAPPPSPISPCQNRWPSARPPIRRHVDVGRHWRRESGAGPSPSRARRRQCSLAAQTPRHGILARVDAALLGHMRRRETSASPRSAVPRRGGATVPSAVAKAGSSKANTQQAAARRKQMRGPLASVVVRLAHAEPTRHARRHIQVELSREGGVLIRTSRYLTVVVLTPHD